jgi:hypothetical protein
VKSTALAATALAVTLGLIAPTGAEACEGSCESVSVQAGYDSSGASVSFSYGTPQTAVADAGPPPHVAPPPPPHVAPPPASPHPPYAGARMPVADPGAPAGPGRPGAPGVLAHPQNAGAQAPGFRGPGAPGAPAHPQGAGAQPPGFRNPGVPSPVAYPQNGVQAPANPSAPANRHTVGPQAPGSWGHGPAAAPAQMGQPHLSDAGRPTAVPTSPEHGR